VNPNTVAQGNARARLSASATGWRDLTDAQRAGWVSLGAMMQRTDSLGQTYTLTGFQAYCSINATNLAVGAAVVSAAPVLTTPDAITSATVTLTAAAFSVAYTPTPLAAGERLLFYASPQRSAGRSFEGDYRLIHVSAAAAASPADVMTAYTARLGAPVVGNKVFMALTRYSSGFESSALQVAQVVA